MKCKHMDTDDVIEHDKKINDDKSSSELEIPSDYPTYCTRFVNRLFMLKRYWVELELHQGFQPLGRAYLDDRNPIRSKPCPLQISTSY